MNEEFHTSKKKEPARTIGFWKKQFLGVDKKILDMVIFEQNLEERDRLTKSQLDFYINKRKNKKL